MLRIHRCQAATKRPKGNPPIYKMEGIKSGENLQIQSITIYTKQIKIGKYKLKEIVIVMIMNLDHSGKKKKTIGLIAI